MNISGIITSTISATGSAAVSRYQVDNPRKTIIVVFTITPGSGAPYNVQQTISGGDVDALGANWGDDDLLNWFVNKNGIRNLDAATAAPATTTAQAIAAPAT
jgi:hypothetical protein